jgi:hypothetical protein
MQFSKSLINLIGGKGKLQYDMLIFNVNTSVCEERREGWKRGRRGRQEREIATLKDRKGGEEGGEEGRKEEEGEVRGGKGGPN